MARSHTPTVHRPLPSGLASPIVLNSTVASVPPWRNSAFVHQHDPAPPDYPNHAVTNNDTEPSNNALQLQLVNDTNQVGPGHDFMVRPFVCKFPGCDRAFARKSDLARHFRIHTNERYRGCGKAFIQRSALTVHTRVHTGERPHHCETCNKAFADSSSLARHRRIHTGKRPYGCKVAGCGRQFARRNTYLKHFKRQHPDLPPPTSNSVRALHVPVYGGGRSQSFLVSNGSNGSGSDTQDYAGSPPFTGPPHVFAASHPPEGSAYFNGGYVNGQLHSSQLAAPTNPALRGYFNQEAQGHGNGGLTHPGTGEQHQGSQAAQGDRSSTDLHAHQSNGIPYNGDASQNGGHVSLSHEYNGDGSIFQYSDNTIPRVPNNNVMSGTNGFYFKSETPVMSQAGQWGSVGGGFAPGQLSMPSVNVHPSYYPIPSQQFAQRPADNKMANPRLQSPLSERAASPELVDINTVPTIKMPNMSQPPYPMFGNVDNQSISAAAMSALHPASGQLHSAPPHMQRFHSAPGVPTLSHTWNHPEPFKASTPGFEGRPLMRRHGSDWAPDHTTPTFPPRDNSEGGDAESKASTPGAVKVEPPQWPQAYAGPPGPRPTPYRFASSGSATSTASSIVNVSSTPSTLPPLSIFPSPNGVAQPHYPAYQHPGSWVNQSFNINKDQQVVTPNVLSRPGMFTPNDQSDDGQISIAASPEKAPAARDRQASGVSVLGTGLAGVTFGDREGSIEEEGKSWTASDNGSFDGEEEDSDEDGDDSDDEDFVLNKSDVKRRGSTGKRGRGNRVTRTGSVKRRVLA